MDSPITTLGVTTLSIHRVAATLEKLISRVEEPGSPSLLTEELSRRLCLQDPVGGRLGVGVSGVPCDLPWVQHQTLGGVLGRQG